jgi:DNA polymerase
MTASEYLPDGRGLRTLKNAAQDCRGCDLYKDATQTVFGQGRSGSDLMLVGEQPGDREDVEGAPFVGPAGLLLDRALKAAAIDRGAVYVTNAVKHFKWRAKGRRRLHQTPRAGEIEACKPWVLAEIDAVKPRALVGLGATAARALFGTKVRVTRDRGRELETSLAEIGAVTIHPSAILRVRDSAEREEAFEELVSDLQFVVARMEGARS